MPYPSTNDLPSNVTNVLPLEAQRQWLRVFNSIYDKTGSEDRARRGAWSIIKKYYRKTDKGMWEKK